MGGRLVYAMRVDEVLPLDVYWKLYPSKRPSQRSETSKRGDNIWHRSRRSWKVVPNAFHNREHRTRDLSGANALVAKEFYYFGRDAIPLPARFQSLLASTQGHKNTSDVRLIEAFWRWLSRSASARGRIGEPLLFDDEGCRAQRTAR